MPIVRIDEKDYDLDLLSEEARAQLGMLQFVDAELQRHSKQVAILQTARMGYSKALNEALIVNQLLN